MCFGVVWFCCVWDVCDVEIVGVDDVGVKFKEKVWCDVGVCYGWVDGDWMIVCGGVVGLRVECCDCGVG